MIIEAFLRAARRDFAPEVLDALQHLGQRLSALEDETLRTPDLAKVMRLSTEFRKRECLSALRQAALLLEEGRTPWQVASKLRDELDAFECRILPLVRRNPSMPLSPLHECLRLAFFCRVQFPRSHERLYTELYC